MDYRLVITKAALEDAQKAYNYYEEISPGLGERLLKQLNIAYTAISAYPSNFGFIDDKKILRDRLLNVFPYSVIYRIEGERMLWLWLYITVTNTQEKGIGEGETTGKIMHELRLLIQSGFMHDSPFTIHALIPPLNS